MHAPFGKMSLYWGPTYSKSNSLVNGGSVTCLLVNSATPIMNIICRENMGLRPKPKPKFKAWGVPGLVRKSSIILFDQLSTHFSSFFRVEFVTSCLHGVS